MNGQTIVYAKPPDGQLEVYGAGLARGIWAEDPSWTHSETGAEQMMLILKRRADVQWSDLIAGTPVWVLRDGQVGFQGRIRQTPSQRALAGDTITVQLEGLTANLADDTLALRAVTADLNDWVDYRATSHSDPTADKAYVDVQIGSGQARLMTPSGSVVAIDVKGRAGIWLDAGPNRSWQSILYQATFSGFRVADLGVSYTCAVYSTDTGSLLGTIVGASAATPINSGIDFSATPSRGIVILMLPKSAGTTTADAWISFSGIQVFADEAERLAAGGAGIRASYLIGKALDKCPLVNSSRTRITATSFQIPHFEGGQQSPLAYIQAANDYHLYQFFLRDGAAGEAPTAVYRPVPTVPTLIARVGQGIEWEDASRSDGSDVYNRVIVQYQDGTGVAQEVTRAAGLLSGTSFNQQSVAQLVNGSFEGDTPGSTPADWVDVFGTIVAANASPPAGSTVYANCTVDGTGKLESAEDIPPGDLVEGRTYQAVALIKTGNNDAKTFSLRIVQDDVNGGETITSQAILYSAAFNAWTPQSITFVAGSDLSLVKFEVYTNDATQASRVIAIDSIRIYEARPTLWDRQGIIRTKVLQTSARMTDVAAAQIGDAFLAAHQRTPLKGTLTVSGASLKTWPGDAPIPAAIVGARYVQDAVLITDTDPDTSDTTRVGNIAAVTYDANTDQAKVSIDQRRDFLDALQARLGIEQG